MADVNGVWSAGLTGLSGNSLPDLFQFGTLVNFLASPGHWSAEHAKEFVNMLRYFFLDFSGRSEGFTIFSIGADFAKKEILRTTDLSLISHVSFVL